MSALKDDRAVGVPGGRPPSINDVAAGAGVSIQTVSRVLNDSPKVAPATRKRVLAVIDELGYRRNPVARALATGRAGVLGVLAPSSALYGPASITAALGVAAVEAGIHLAVEHVIEFEAASVAQGMNRLTEQLVSAIVVVAPVRAAAAALADTTAPVPVVSVDSVPAAGRLDVSVDQEAGGFLATQHLLDLGHDTVWHVAGPDSWHDAQARRRGWEAALRAGGREIPPHLDGDWSAGSGYRAGQILARIADATAVFAANDAQALGVLRAMAEAGRRVPQDVSVVGFDDTPESAHFLPPLTTVRQEFAELGRTALRTALQLVALGRGEVVAPVSSVRLPPQLVARRSSAPVTRG
ncbi:LacI family DNA-binding transcriptional regulator [Kineococcus gynurae]|uniref:LacI family DNA-binding transcriptional regulator n=1 Tax=Kineococcus gynurae TaxID=452979 RepID=A0ABV5LUK2_9ACTN